MSVTENLDTKADSPPFRTGDRLTQPEFHRLYEQTPPGFRAELIEGTVYVASPVGLDHSQFHINIGAIIALYASQTPFLIPSSNGSIIVNDRTELQPDIWLMLVPEKGGQSRRDGVYLRGAPELVIEVAYSSRAIDLHHKLNVYTDAGVREYLVICCKEAEVHIFDLPNGGQKLQKEGIYQSPFFGGLWLDLGSLLANKIDEAVRAVQRGLASPEHAEFVKQLAAKD